MDNQQEQAPHMSSIPKRPSKPSVGKQSFSTRSFSAHRPIQSISNGNLEQQPSSSSPKHKHDSMQSQEEDNRSKLSEMATIKSVSVQPQTAESLRPLRSPVRTNRTIQYTAAVNPVRARKQGFLVWVATLGFLNLKSM
jgi:hypothetical protein